MYNCECCRKGPQGASLISNHSGYTLFLVLELLVIIMILFTVLLRDTHFVRVLAVREVQRVQAHFLAESGIAKAEYFLSGNEGQSMLWESEGITDAIPLYGETKISSKRFGLFSYMIGKGTRLRTTCTIRAIAGREVPEDLSPVLVLHGKVGSLALMPDSKIEGKVVLYRGKICQGQSVREANEPGLALELKEVPELPFDSSQVIKAFEKFKGERTTACTTATAIAQSVVLDPKKKIGGDSANVEVVNGDCMVESGTFLSRTVIVSGRLTVQGSARCLLCRFSAKQISIEGGSTDRCVFYSEKKTVIKQGEHNSQFFSSDSISVGSSAAIGSMSIFALFREGQADSLATIAIAPQTVIRGTIICYSDTLARKWARLPSVIFGKGCSLAGICMTDGDIDINGATVAGHLWARSIVTSDGSKSYVNYLFGTKIRKETGRIVFPLIGDGTAKIIADPLSTEYSVRAKKKNAAQVADTIKS